jgi:phosphoribosylamine-glycine ligase
LIDHLYTASNEPVEGVPNIEFLNHDDLIYKAKALQIDLILLADKTLIKDGLVEILKKNLLNVISVNQKWFNLESSRLIAKQLISHYSINNPAVVKAPMSFPIVIKTDRPMVTKIANSMHELVKIKEELAEQTTFLEEYLKGEVYYLTILWDGKSMLAFDENIDLTEVQRDRLDLYKTKLNFLLSDEKADFIGLFTTKLIWAKNDWHVLDFIMHTDEKVNSTLIKKDFLYLLNLAIYQKLNEIK